MTRRIAPELLPYHRDPAVPLAGLSGGQLLGMGVDNFALYTALREARRQLVGAAANYLVSWPFDISNVDTSLYPALTNSRAILVPQLVPPGEAIDGICWVQQTAGAYTAVNSNQVAAYTSDGSTWTRQAVSVSNGNLWKNGPGLQVAPFSAQLPAFGTWTLLWAAAVWNQSALVTTPVIGGVTVGGGGIGAVSPGLATFSFQIDFPAQANLPANLLVGASTIGDTNHEWLAFYRNHT